MGFDDIQSMRQLERTPSSKVATVLPGVVWLDGEVVKKDKLTLTPYSQTEVIAFHYLLEEEKRDSDGKTHWSTVNDYSHFNDFILRDESGEIEIKKNSITWNLRERVRRVEGRFRHTEWHLEVGEPVSVYGVVSGDFPKFHVDFRLSGDYTPIVTVFGRNYEMNRFGMIAVYSIWFGLTLFILAIIGLVRLFKWHRILWFLSLMSLSIASILVYYGLLMFEDDLRRGSARLVEQRQTLNDLKNARPDATQLSVMEDYLRKLEHRFAQQISQFPENVLIVRLGIDPPHLEERGSLQGDHIEPVASSGILVWISFLVGIAGLGILLYWGLKRIKLKRMIENLPTTPSRGVVYGVNELKGIVSQGDSQDLLIAPYTRSKCCWYHYIELHKQGSGKNARWVTVVNERAGQPFWLNDQEGRIEVDPEMAEVVGVVKINTKAGSRHYTEYSIEIGEEVYALGPVKIDQQRSDQLHMAHDEVQDVPFLISNYSEAELMIFKATKGMLYFGGAFSAVMLAGLNGLAINGAYHPINYLYLALLAPATLCFLMIVLHYNDIVFLSRRVDRAWANIQVSLKKRHTLVPELEKILKAFLIHEKGLQTSLARLRSLQGKSDQDVENCGVYMEAEQRFTQELILVVERYPQLRSNELAQQLTRQIIKLENEVALMRQGFNDACTSYNTRIHSFPDLFLACFFRFKRRSLLDYEANIYEEVQVSLS